MKILKNLMFICVLFGLISSPLYAETISWDWNDFSLAGDDWSSYHSSRYIGGVYPWLYANNYNYSGIHYGTDGDGYIYTDRDTSNADIDRNYVRYSSYTPSREFLFTSGELDKTVNTKYVTFDLRNDTNGSVKSIYLNGKSVDTSYIHIQNNVSDGWDRYTVPINATISQGQQAKITLNFYENQGAVAIDNFSLSTASTDTISVIFDSQIYKVPIGYKNFTGVLDASGEKILASKEVAGTLLASSQALGDIMRFDLSLKDSLIEMGLAAETGIHIETIKDGLTTTTALAIGAAINPATASEQTMGQALSIAGDLFSNTINLTGDQVTLALAWTQIEFAIQKMEEVADFKNRVALGEAITFEDLKQARESLRAVEGSSQAAVKLARLIQGEEIGILENLWDTSLDVVEKMAGPVISIYNMESTEFSSLAQIDEALEAVRDIAATPVFSPLDDDLALVSAYQETAVERGYTSNPIVDLLAGLVPPNLTDAVYMAPYDEENQCYVHDLTVTPSAHFLLDPEIAIGFQYEVKEGPSVESINLPSDIGDGLYSLWLFDQASANFLDSGTELIGGIPFFFGGEGSRLFQIRGIETGAALDPYYHESFVADLTFTGFGDLLLSQTPLTVDISNTSNPVPEPSTILIFSVGLGALISYRRKERK